MARGIFGGSAWNLQWWRVGSSVAARGTSSQARSQTPAPCTGSVESSPLVHQGSRDLCVIIISLVLYGVCGPSVQLCSILLFGCAGSPLQHVGLVARGLWDQTIHVPCAGRQIFAHSATREVPSVLFSNVVA